VASPPADGHRFAAHQSERWDPPGEVVRRPAMRRFGNGCQAEQRSAPPPSRPGAPDGGSAPDGGQLVCVGHERGRAVLAIPRKRVATSRRAVYPPREARAVRREARDRVAPASLSCDTRDWRKPSAVARASHDAKKTNGGERWPMTEPASRRRDRSQRCGSSTAPPEGICPEPPVWRRTCCTITTSNSEV
jgi:hypothetical protein